MIRRPMIRSCIVLVLLAVGALARQASAQVPGNPTPFPVYWAKNGAHIHNSNPGKVGIGTGSPAADLDIRGALTTPLSGLVSVTIGSNHLTGGGSGTLFTTELRSGDALRVGSEIFTVASIADDANLFLDVNSATGHGSVTAYRDGDLLRVQDGDGNPALLVDKSGNASISGSLGIGANGPQVDKLKIVAENSTVPRSSALSLVSPTTAVGDCLGLSFCQTNTEDRVRAGIFALAEHASGHASGLGFYTRSALDSSTLQPSDLRMLVDSGGTVSTFGSFFSPDKHFRIDHPLDPYNKTLVHACVESSERVDLYRGNVLLDRLGFAMVVLPDWFEALNRSFSYQLTPIGAAAPELHIASEVAGGRFQIAGGAPGMKVSWQVTGVRHDAYARAHPMEVVQDKGMAQGTLLHPREFEESFVSAPR